jgi:hypothetical protein
MRKYHVFLQIITVVMLLISCRKETSKEGGTSPVGGTPTDTTATGGDTSNTSNTEVGNWKFISLHATVLQTTEYTQDSNAVKSVTSSDYTTENNDGTIKFDGSKMTSTGLTYSVNTIAKGYSYFNGSPEDTVEAPFAFTLPPYSSTTPYKKVGTDSLYFDSGAGSIGGTSTQSVPAGYKLKFDGDKMTMTTKADEVKTELNPLGFTQTTTNHAAVVITLQKK